MGLLDFLSPKKKKEERKKRLIGELNNYVNQIKARKGLVPISTGILLKKGEDAYLEGKSLLQETKAIRYHKRSGIGFRVMKGVYVGGSGGTSQSQEEWRVIDEGQVILTNKRFIFNGTKENRVIPLEKIVSVTPWLDAVEISAENRKKNMLFTMGNPYIWAFIIQFLIKIENPKQIGDANIDITFR